jgi:hypothetical protein
MNVRVPITETSPLLVALNDTRYVVPGTNGAGAPSC